MKVLLLKDVYKLGRAGDVKKVADGYGRNYLLPQRLAALATPGMLKQADRIGQKASEERVRLNQELGDVAEQLTGLELFFPVKAGETGRLYGSVTTLMIADAIQNAAGITIERRQIDSQPIKITGVHKIDIRLTIDLVPVVKVIVHPEDEAPESVYALEEDGVLPDEPAEDFAELRAELEAEEAMLETRAAEADETVADSVPTEVDSDQIGEADDFAELRGELEAEEAMVETRTAEGDETTTDSEPTEVDSDQAGEAEEV